MGNGEFRIEMSGDTEKYQRMLDRMGREHRGRPIADIESALRASWQELGGDLSDSELSTYAQHIKDGTRIVIDLKMRH